MEGLSPSQFADKLGVQRSGVSHLLAGRNKPSFEFISKMMAAYPKLNPDWLIMGTGKAYRDMPGAVSQTEDDLPFDAEEPKAQLQENTVNDDLPDLFSAPQQTITPPEPSENRVKQLPVAPAPGKRIAQITIFYTDGTYEVR